HSPGSTCYYVKDLGLLLSGDTLFQGGPGATGRSFSSRETIEDSIRERLFVLPDETVVHTGHGPQTTIGAEKENAGGGRLWARLAGPTRVSSRTQEAAPVDEWSSAGAASGPSAARRRIALGLPGRGVPRGRVPGRGFSASVIAVQPGEVGVVRCELRFPVAVRLAVPLAGAPLLRAHPLDGHDQRVADGGYLGDGPHDGSSAHLDRLQPLGRVHPQ